MVNGTKGKTITPIQRARLDRLTRELACGITQRRIPTDADCIQDVRLSEARVQKEREENRKLRAQYNALPLREQRQWLRDGIGQPGADGDVNGKDTALKQLDLPLEEAELKPEADRGNCITAESVRRQLPGYIPFERPVKERVSFPDTSSCVGAALATATGIPWIYPPIVRILTEGGEQMRTVVRR